MGDGRLIQPVTPAGGDQGGQRTAAAVHRGLMQQGLLVCMQKVVAPLHERSQRPAGIGRRLLVEQRQTAFDQRQQLPEAEHVHARRRELDGKRQSVDAPGDRCNESSGFGVELEARPRGARALQEERHGR